MHFKPRVLAKLTNLITNDLISSVLTHICCKKKSFPLKERSSYEE